jgi:Ca-activated chloride channel family protein
MPAPPNRIACLKLSFSTLSLLSLLHLSLLSSAVDAQTSLNDIHIAPMETASTMANVVEASSFTSASRFPAMFPAIKTEVNLVTVPVSVTDPMQRLVTGLAQDNFQIFDGKKPQEIRHFSSEDAPISVGIILDVSGSMKSKMDRVRDAVNQFCESANLQDEFFLITFSDQPHLASDFTSRPEDIQKELLFTQPKGRTALLDAIYMGLHKIKEAKNGKKALLIISDGGDNHSRYSERDVKAAAKESDVLIYAIGTFDRYAATQEEMLGPVLLSEIAGPTGGRAFALENAIELPALAHRIGTELRTQYVLYYRPQNVPRDGRWHRIKVKLRLPKRISFLQAHARAGYYSPGG